MSEELFHFYSRCSRSTKWFNEALKEKGLPKNTKQLNYTILPKSVYETVKHFSQNKIFDFCFIGSFLIQKKVFIKRKWILDFIKQNFTSNSYLQFTDNKTKRRLNSLGTFDYSRKKTGFVPKQVRIEIRDYFDEEYYKTMCHSNFCLCPAGDLFWSMRFFEALMCKTIPIVKTKDETFRSKEESLLDYKYYLANDPNIVFKQDWADYNYELFLKHHTLEFL